MDWGLPQALVEAISFHHLPEKAIDNSKIVSVVHIADIICSMFGTGSSASILGGQPHQHALSTVDLRTEDVDTIIEQLPDVIKEVDIF
jgi:HD-like signal output (HDOD) protein